MNIVVADTHCYPGCRMRISGGDHSSRVLIEFSDGTVVLGEFTRRDDGASLAVPEYRTAHGSRIGAKLWSLRPDAEAGSWRIKARLPAA